MIDEVWIDGTTPTSILKHDDVGEVDVEASEYGTTTDKHTPPRENMA